MREKSTEYVKYRLKRFGWDAEDIKESNNSKRADLIVSIENEEYIIEAKEKAPQINWVEFKKSTESGVATSLSRQVKPWSAIAKTIKIACRQLLSTPCSNQAFRLLWIVFFGDDDFVVDCYVKRLLGTERLSVFSGLDQSFEIIDCHHYSHNSFSQCPFLDAAIISCTKGDRLYVNYYSEQLYRFRECRLYKLYNQRRAAIDPGLEEKSGKALMLGKDFNGCRNGKDQYEYIYKKYAIRTSLMTDYKYNAFG